MNPLMNCKLSASSIATATYITFIWFLSSMSSPMVLKVCIVLKAVAKYITFIRFLSSMISLMNCKPHIIIKRLATYVSFIW